jgi:uncharacterized membrane protein
MEAGMRLPQAREFVVRRVTGGDAAGQTATLVATAAVGASFARGLMPRRSIDQAIATGLVGSTQYGLVVTTHSVASELARALVGRRAETLARPATQAIATAGLIGAGALVERSLPPRRGEPVRRAVLRTVGHRATTVGAASLVVGAIDAADQYAAGHGRKGRLTRVLGSNGARLVGIGIASWSIRRCHRNTDPGVLPPPVDPLTGDPGKQAGGSALVVDAQPPVAKSLALGAAVAAGLEGIAFADALLSRLVAAGVRRLGPEGRPYAGAAGHLVSLGALAGGVLAGLEYANRRAEFGGAGIEAAYTAPPDVQTVSGGPASGVAWSTLSREGVRFVNMALTPAEISETTGVPLNQTRPPVRAFAGLASAASVDARVDLVMEDLERLGAFERSLICVASPTGSGYVNYVAVETLEYLTRGDCATAALQYSLRPSFLSMDRVRIGREQNRALLHALEWRLRAIPQDRRPRLVGFGESLGAQTLQDAFLSEGAHGFHRVGIDRALFLGTPATSKWAEQWRLSREVTDPGSEIVEIASYDEWIYDDGRDRDTHRYFLLSHHEDPITRFEPALAVQQPPWLGPPRRRPPGVPRSTHWHPLTTFFLTGIDMVNAMSVVPGSFMARGHDYRADLARMVSVAFGLPVSDLELLSIERALRRREADWAERRMLAEQLQRAKETAKRVVGAGPAPTGPAQTGPAQTGPAQTGPAQAGPAQAGPAQAGPA